MPQATPIISTIKMYEGELQFTRRSGCNALDDVDGAVPWSGTAKDEEAGEADS